MLFILTWNFPVMKLIKTSDFHICLSSVLGVGRPGRFQEGQRPCCTNSGWTLPHHAVHGKLASRGGGLGLLGGSGG